MQIDTARPDPPGEDDLAALTQLRNRAVTAGGGDPEHAPAWAFVAHPIARALMEAAGVALSHHLARTGDDEEAGLSWTARVSGWRVGHTNMRLGRDRGAITLDAGNQMARIVVEGDYPETILQGLVGTPIRDILGLDGLASSEAGCARIRDAWSDDGRLGLTVSCRLVPLADPPQGIDAGWLQQWLERHA